MALDKAPRIYTYKITFEETRHFYYGVHKEKRFDEYYMGSPITHKWMWNFYTPEKQILEVFDYSDEGWLKANEVEQRLIKNFYIKDNLCLNENCGGKISIGIRRNNGLKTIEIHKTLGIGLYGLTKEQRIETSLKMVRDKRGAHKLNREERSKISRETAQRNLKAKTGMYANLSENGKKGAETNRANGTGLWGFSFEYRSEISKKTCAQKWQCTITGYVSNAGGLANYQKARGIDKSNRIRLE